MIRSGSNHLDRVAASWLQTRWQDALKSAAAAISMLAIFLCRLRRDHPELRMSREWLDECEQQSSKLGDDI